MTTTLITFASFKGGVSKTTHAVALTAGLLDLGKTVRFIEADEQGNSGAWADEVAEIHENLDSVFVPVKNTDFAAAQDAIADHASGADFAIVDTAGASNAGTLASLYLADLVLVPFALRDWDMEGLERLNSTYEELFKRFEEDSPEAIVALYRRGVSFISNSEKEKLRTLSERYIVRAGLLDNPNIPKWISANRTPAQLRNGEPPSEGAQPLRDDSLLKVEGFITEFTTTVLEMFDGSQA